MEAQAAVSYPLRRESERLLMFFDERVTDLDQDFEEMDRHVARLQVKYASK